jgi:hypothetical protein|tara:strand:+ start:412 stop:780 length:369 start_codon:yes stop_codon:yes gene_type:complete
MVDFITNFRNTAMASDKAKKLDLRKQRQHKKAKQKRHKGRKAQAQVQTAKASVSAHTSKRVGLRAVQLGTNTAVQGAKMGIYAYEGDYMDAAKSGLDDGYTQPTMSQAMASDYPVASARFVE